MINPWRRLWAAPLSHEAAALQAFGGDAPCLHCDCSREIRSFRLTADGDPFSASAEALLADAERVGWTLGQRGASQAFGRASRRNFAWLMHWMRLQRERFR